jgi:tol-pal system protein YbgF
MTPRQRLGLLAAGLWLGGCANFAEYTGAASYEDVMALRKDITVLQQSVQQARAQADRVAAQVDGRMREQSSDAERQATALARRVEGFTTTLTNLTARVDELASRLETLQRDVRSAAPRGGAAAGPARTPPPSGPARPPAPSTPSAPTTGGLQPQDIYQAAYIDFSKGSYALAIAGFREFLRRFPDHELAGGGQYWIGEAHVSLARGYANAGQTEQVTQALEQAVREFRKVVANYPRSDKTPTALYKEALTLIELKQPALAQSRLQYLVDNFPQAEETPLARERLTALKERGG